MASEINYEGVMAGAMFDSVKKLDPRSEMRNPVMFLTYVGSIITTLSFLYSLYNGIFSLFDLLISVWLWFTVLFANFAEALAEEMRRDPRVVMFGEGVATKRQDLVIEFGKSRVRNTPLAEAIIAVAKRLGQPRVVLSGGCFQNRYLTESTVQRLQEEGFRPYWHQRIPPNDGGIALGQVVAALRQRGAGCRGAGSADL